MSLAVFYVVSVKMKMQIEDLHGDKLIIKSNKKANQIRVIVNVKGCKQFAAFKAHDIDKIILGLQEAKRSLSENAKAD